MMLRFQTILFFSVLLILSAACKPDVQFSSQQTENIAGKWDSIPKYFADVEACYVAFISANGKVYEYKKGENTAGKAIDENTFFEAASLSKTYFSYLYWKLLFNNKLSDDSISIKNCNNSAYIKFSPYEFLSHTSQIETDSCAKPNPNRGTFSYSEYGYLALQNAVEIGKKKNLEELAKEYIFAPLQMQNSTFLWKNVGNNYVNGFVKKDSFLRPMHTYSQPQSNGSLLVSAQDLLVFTKKLMQSRELDSMKIIKTNIPGFDKLHWGRGIGTELNNGKAYHWQWGTNWCYNNLILINETDNTAFICLTNSISGKSAIRQTADYLLSTHLQLFDYIGWY